MIVAVKPINESFVVVKICNDKRKESRKFVARVVNVYEEVRVQFFCKVGACLFVKKEYVWMNVVSTKEILFVACEV